MAEARWQSLGPVETLRQRELQPITLGKIQIALSCRDGAFGAIANSCNHIGGPLGSGTIKGDYVVCPWHSWMFHRQTGAAQPGIPAAVPSYPVKVENGEVWIDLANASKRVQAPHPAHALAREPGRAPGPLRVAGISTTAMDRNFPRYSASEDLLQVVLARAGARGAETRLLRLNDLRFRACEGYYSKSARACTWPCTITQMDPGDELTEVYESLVFWADAVVIATPIRWGNASSLYFKMIERMNCIQNQITTHDRVLIRDKVAGFVIVGGQDNVQAVAGQMLTFFGELGFQFPQFPFIAHSRGWSAEDMENNVREVQESAELRAGAAALADRCLDMAGSLVAAGAAQTTVAGGGRKANPLA